MKYHFGSGTMGETVPLRNYRKGLREEREKDGKISRKSSTLS